MEEGGDRDFMPDVRVKDGEVIAGDGFTFECVYTPGHTSNHMCFALREEKALFTGDHVMGWSTTVVTPPDGDMAAYMASLRKLLARDDRNPVADAWRAGEGSEAVLAGLYRSPPGARGADPRLHCRTASTPSPRWSRACMRMWTSGCIPPPPARSRPI